ALRKGCGEAIVAWSLCCLRQAVRTGPYAAGRPRAGAGWTGRVRSTKCRRGPNRADITTWEVRRSPAVKIRTTTGVEDMAKKVTGFLKLQVPAGAANRAGARPARPQHHGVLQGVQRADPEDRKEHADPGDHHHLSGSLLHLRDEDAASVFLPQEGGEARQRLQDARSRQGRLGHQEADTRDRRAEDEGSQRQRYRRGDEDDRRLRPLDGPYGAGVTVMAI